MTFLIILDINLESSGSLEFGFSAETSECAWFSRTFIGFGALSIPTDGAERMAQAFIEDHANTCCWTFFVARLLRNLRKSQIATYFCLIKACRAYGGRPRVVLGISKSSHIISENLRTSRPASLGRERNVLLSLYKWWLWSSILQLGGCARQCELVSACLREEETVESGWKWMNLITLITLKNTVHAAN